VRVKNNSESEADDGIRETDLRRDEINTEKAQRHPTQTAQGEETPVIEA